MRFRRWAAMPAPRDSAETAVEEITTPRVCHWVARVWRIPLSLSASAERRDARRILEAVPSRIWRIAFRNFAIACSATVEEIFKVAGSRAGDKAEQEGK